MKGLRYITGRNNSLAATPLSTVARSSLLRRAFNTFKGSGSIPEEVNSLMQDLGVKKSEYNAVDRDVIKTVSPITGETIGSIKKTNPIEYRLTSSLAREASDSWRKVHPTERGEFVILLAQVYQKALPELTKLNQLQTGKLSGDARGEENESADIAFKAGGYALESTSTRTPTKKLGEYVVTSREPLGVVGNIGPYNYPGVIPNALHTAPAIAAGNSVIIKPNELNPLLSLAYGSLFRKASELFAKSTGTKIPQNLVQYVQGGPEIGTLIASDPNIDKIVFTGSSHVGQKIRKAVVEHGGRDPLMETGGHNAMGITSDVFKNPNALRQAFDYMKESYIGDTYGQRCSCLSRLYVPREHLDQVVNEVLQFNRDVLAHHTGDPRNPKTILGPMMHPNTIKELNQIKDAAAKDGATVYGGKRILAPKGYEKANYMEPIVIVEQGQNKRMLEKEPFGPCMHIIPVDHDRDITAFMNAGKKDGLTSSFFSLDPELIADYHQTVKTGNRNVGQKTSGAPVYAAFGPHNGGQVAGQGTDSFNQYTQRVTSIENTTLHLPDSNRTPSVKKILDEGAARSHEKQVIEKTVSELKPLSR